MFRKTNTMIFYFATNEKLFQFWIFPNLTEDVGVIESFKPAYVYTYDAPKKVNNKNNF